MVAAPVAVEHVAGEVVDAGEHAADRQRLQHAGGQQQPEVARAGHDPQLVAQAARARRDRADRRVAGADVGADDADQDDHGHRHAHQPVAVAAADGVADHRRASRPASRIVKARIATRHVISRVRSA